MNSKYTFTVGDLSFFKKYYSKLSKSAQNQVKGLVAGGQLEIVHGGWVPTDEACTNYADVIRNFEQAHNFVL